MLDVDTSRFLSACGVEPTPEAVEIARRLHRLGLLVTALDGNGRPVVPGEGKPPRTAAEYLADARMERDRETEERERWRAKIAAWDEGIERRTDTQPVAWLTRTEHNYLSAGQPTTRIRRGEALYDYIRRLRKKARAGEVREGRAKKEGQGMTGQQRLEALLRAARVYESHDMALAAPEVQQAMREMAPLVERDPVRELALRIFVAVDMSPVDCARTAVDVLAAIDDELARLRAARKPPIK